MGVAVGKGVAVRVAVGGTVVAVRVAVGVTSVAVGGTDVAVGGTGVAVGGTGVGVLVATLVWLCKRRSVTELGAKA